MQEAVTVSVSVARTPADVYAFAADPRNLPRWSFIESIEPAGERWAATVPGGRSLIAFAPRNDLGVLDHDVEIGDGVVVHVPLRVVANGAGSEVLFTVFRADGATDAEHEADLATVRADLTALKTLLEA